MLGQGDWERDEAGAGLCEAGAMNVHGMDRGRMPSTCHAVPDPRPVATATELDGEAGEGRVGECGVGECGVGGGGVGEGGVGECRKGTSTTCRPPLSIDDIGDIRRHRTS